MKTRQHSGTATPTRLRRGLCALLAVGALALVGSARAADSVYFIEEVPNDPELSYDDTLRGTPLKWDTDDERYQKIRVYLLDTQFGAAIDPTIIEDDFREFVTDTEILASMTRSLAKWNDNDLTEFRFAEGAQISEFAPRPAEFGSFADDVRADGYNVMSFQDPEVVPGDGVNFLAVKFFFFRDFDPTENGSNPEIFVTELDNGDIGLGLGIEPSIDVVLPGGTTFSAGQMVDSDVSFSSIATDYRLWPANDSDLGNQGVEFQDTLGTLDIESLLLEGLGRIAGLAPSHLNNATMANAYLTRADGGLLPEFATSPYQRRELNLDDEISMGKAYPSGGYKSAPGIGGELIDGRSVDPFLGLTSTESALVAGLPFQPVYFGRPRTDGAFDLDTVIASITRFGITEPTIGPIQLEAHVMTGRGFEINSGTNTNTDDQNPSVTDEVYDSDLAFDGKYEIRGLPAGTWYAATRAREFGYDDATNLTFTPATVVPVEFFGGVDPSAPIPGDGSAAINDGDGTSIRSAYAQLNIAPFTFTVVDEETGEEQEFFTTDGTFTASFSDGASVLDARFSRNHSTARIVFPNGRIFDVKNANTGYTGFPFFGQFSDDLNLIETTFPIDDRNGDRVGLLSKDYRIRALPAAGIDSQSVIEITWTFTNTTQETLQFGMAHHFDLSVAFPNIFVGADQIRDALGWGGPGEPSVPTTIDAVNNAAAPSHQVSFLFNQESFETTTPDRVLTVDSDRVQFQNLWNVAPGGVLEGVNIDRDSGIVARWNPRACPPGESVTVAMAFAPLWLGANDDPLQELLGRVENGYPRRNIREIYADDPTQAFPLPVGGFIPNVNIVTNTGARTVFFATDVDGDGVVNDLDNCPFTPNSDQADADGDLVGDVCEGDFDGDGVADPNDNCPDAPNADQADADQDGIGDACDDDRDADGVPDAIDNCVLVPNPDQSDRDQDGVGDACDGDIDGDGIPDDFDNCPFVPNPGQENLDGDNLGDACENDTDNDTIPDPDDNCPREPNGDQADEDGDGIGNVCEAGFFLLQDTSPVTVGLDEARIPVSDLIASGSATGDLNNDGWADIVIGVSGNPLNAASSLMNRAYINQGAKGQAGFFKDLTFGIDGIVGTADDRLPFVRDVTETPLLVDYDLDGDLDIVFFNRGLPDLALVPGTSPSRVLLNTDVNDPRINPDTDSDDIGDGFFIEVTSQANPGWLNTRNSGSIIGGLTALETKGAAADIDADGDPDIVVPSTVSTATYADTFDLQNINWSSGTPFQQTVPPYRFSERVMINRRNELVDYEGNVLPLGTPDAFLTYQVEFPDLYALVFPTEATPGDTLDRRIDGFWFRDETLGRDGLFGGTGLNQDRMPPTYPDQTEVPGFNEDEDFSSTTAVVFGTFMPSPYVASSGGGGSVIGSFAPDFFVANRRTGGAAFASTTDGTQYLMANQDLFDVVGNPGSDGIPDGIYYMVNYGDEPFDPPNMTAQGTTLFLGFPDSEEHGDIKGPRPPEFNEINANGVYVVGGVAADITGTGSPAFIGITDNEGIVVVDRYRPGIPIDVGYFGALVSRGIDGNLLTGTDPAFLGHTEVQILRPSGEFPMYSDWRLGNSAVTPGTRGRGIAAADMDRDGAQDVVYVGDSFEGADATTLAPTFGSLNVFLNDDGIGSRNTIVDVTDENVENLTVFAGADVDPFDMDNDGDFDVFVTVGGGQARLFSNSLFVPSLPPNLYATNDLPVFMDTSVESLARAFNGLINPQFAPGVDYAAATSSVTALDIDRDGDLDVAIAGGQEISEIGDYAVVFKNTGSPAIGGVKSLVPAALGYPAPRLRQNAEITDRFSLPLETTLRPYSSIVNGDFDNDGDLDLVAGVFGQQPRFFKNIDAREDSSYLQLPGASPRDINSLVAYQTTEPRKRETAPGAGDGFPDNTMDNSLLGDGAFEMVNSTVFPDQAISNAAFFTREVAIGDIDNDGYLDIYLANGLADSGAPDALLANRAVNNDPRTLLFENETFSRLPLIDVDGEQSAQLDDTADAHFVDVDNDGDLDIVIANSASLNPAPNFSQDCELLLNNGSGVFTKAPRSNFPVPTGFYQKVIAGDFFRQGDVSEDADGDGIVTDTEILGFNATVQAITADTGTAPSVRTRPAVALKVVEIQFDPNNSNRQYLTRRAPRYIDRDRNGSFDAHFDVIFVGESGSFVYMFNDGEGRFTDISSEVFPAALLASSAPGMYDIRAGDLNLDGWQDLMIAAARGDAQNDLPSALLLVNRFSTSDSNPERIGRFDDVTLTELPNPLTALLSATVTDPRGNPRGVELFDLDADGDLDMYVAEVGSGTGVTTTGALDYVYTNRTRGENFGSRTGLGKSRISGSGPTVNPSLAVNVISPRYVSQGSEVTLNIYGRNFDGGAEVTFTPEVEVLSPPVVRSSTTLEVRVRIPAGAIPGERIVTVLNPDGEISTAPPDALFVVLQTTTTTVRTWEELE